MYIFSLPLCLYIYILFIDMYIYICIPFIIIITSFYTVLLVAKVILVFWIVVRYVAKLVDGTIFDRKGYDGEEPFEFKVDEGRSVCLEIRTTVCLHEDMC